MNKQITIVQQTLEALDLNSLAKSVVVGAERARTESPVCHELYEELEDAEMELRLTAMPSLADVVKSTRESLKTINMGALCACGLHA